MGLFDDVSTALFGGGDTGSGDWYNLLRQYQQLKTPDIASQEISPESYVNAGELATELENPEMLGMTDALQNIQLDPRLRKTQTDALAQLEKIAGSGFTSEDKAALQLALNKVEADANARNQALLQQQDMRGVGSSDMATAMRAQNAQSAANRASEAALSTALEGRNRALQALTGSSDLARALEQSDYQREAAIAENLNAREAANVNAKNAAQARNVGAKNAAAQFNLQNKQTIADNNVTARNQAQQHNKGLIQQQYDNQLARLAGMSGATGGVASAKKADQDSKNAMMGHIISGGAKIYGAKGG